MYIDLNSSHPLIPSTGNLLLVLNCNLNEWKIGLYEDLIINWSTAKMSIFLRSNREKGKERKRALQLIRNFLQCNFSFAS